ncbi:tryptophan synthase beta subunit-like PLP-dependent enzyme [Pilobolus umbonatus]|nr:tryptophan synthase beta subunit-like PLP-dependent enzyme [Pilobolus umbonatus]
MIPLVTIDKVFEAAERIKVHHTPVLTCSTLNDLVSIKDLPIQLFFKCELFQKTGSFKFRGASNAVHLLTEEEASKGVVTHSSGNHAQALALAANQRGIKSYIVMPRTTPRIKKNAVIGYGAEIIECEPLQSAREKTANEIIQKTGATFIHPYNNISVIAGQGTIALELLSQVDDLDALIIPVGGGGMLTGCALTAKTLRPSIKIFAAEPVAVNDCYRSFKSKKRCTNEPTATSVADGLLTNIGDIAYSELHYYVDDVFTVTEQEIVKAMQLIWERMKLHIEPSAAVGLAVALYNREFRALRGRMDRIGIILCGGNVDIFHAAELFQKYK